MKRRVLMAFLPLVVLLSLVGSGYAFFFFIKDIENIDVEQQVQVVVDEYAELGTLEVTPEASTIYVDQDTVQFDEGFTGFDVRYTFVPNTENTYPQLRFRYVLTLSSGLSNYFSGSGEPVDDAETTYEVTKNMSKPVQQSNSSFVSTDTILPTISYKDGMKPVYKQDYLNLFSVLASSDNQTIRFAVIVEVNS